MCCYERRRYYKKNVKVNLHCFCLSFFLLLNRWYRFYRGVVYVSFFSAYLEHVIRSFIVCIQCTGKLMQHNQQNVDSSEYMWVSSTGMRLLIDDGDMQLIKLNVFFFSLTIIISLSSIYVHSCTVSLSSFFRSYLWVTTWISLSFELNVKGPF